MPGLPVALVVTSINEPNAALKSLAKGAIDAEWDFFIAGDTKSPGNFVLDGCTFLSVDQQLTLGFKFAEICPTRHYARKNIAYLKAIRNGAKIIVETDDDNLPYSEFFFDRNRYIDVRYHDQSGWVNVYRYFSDANIWPRGFPLSQINNQLPKYEDLYEAKKDCPIQQGLVNDNPDVDAIYRLVNSPQQSFAKDRYVALASGAWCPFNSQNTTWWKEAFPLLYLPAYCSFRMTDIWRSFVAQRIAWTCGWEVLFHGPTAWQERNEHDLMQDFTDEIPGYLNNERIKVALDELNLGEGTDAIPANLRKCYARLCEMDLIGKDELPLLDAWLLDLATLL